MLYSKSVTNKVTEGENIREPAKHTFAYIEDVIDYMSLALFPKEGEVTKTNQVNQENLEEVT